MWLNKMSRYTKGSIVVLVGSGVLAVIQTILLTFYDFPLIPTVVAFTLFSMAWGGLMGWFFSK